MKAATTTGSALEARHAAVRSALCQCAYKLVSRSERDPVHREWSGILDACHREAMRLARQLAKLQSLPHPVA